MKETRTFRVSGKRFTRANLHAIAQMFLRLATDLGVPKDKVNVKFVVSTQDGVTYESEDLRHFEEGAALDLKPVESVGFSVTTYGPSRDVSLNLSHGDSHYANKLQVSGDDEQWVHATFSRLHERLQAIEPSHSWFTKHPRLFFHLLAVILGFSASCLIRVIVGMTLGFFVPTNADVNPAEHPFLVAFVKLFETPGVKILWFWLIGLPYAWIVRDWILAGYPSVDLNVGPTSTRLAEMRRTRIRWALAFVVVPVLVNFGYDLFKTHVSDATSNKPKAAIKAPR